MCNYLLMNWLLIMLEYMIDFIIMFVKTEVMIIKSTAIFLKFFTSVLVHSISFLILKRIKRNGKMLDFITKCKSFWCITSAECQDWKGKKYMKSLWHKNCLSVMYMYVYLYVCICILLYIRVCKFTLLYFILYKTNIRFIKRNSVNTITLKRNSPTQIHPTQPTQHNPNLTRQT